MVLHLLQVGTILLLLFSVELNSISNVFSLIKCFISFFNWDVMHWEITMECQKNWLTTGRGSSVCVISIRRRPVRVHQKTCRTCKRSKITDKSYSFSFSNCFVSWGQSQGFFGFLSWRLSWRSRHHLKYLKHADLLAFGTFLCLKCLIRLGCHWVSTWSYLAKHQ